MGEYRVGLKSVKPEANVLFLRFKSVKPKINVFGVCPKVVKMESFGGHV